MKSLRVPLSAVAVVALFAVNALAQVRIVQTNSGGDNISLIDPATNKVVGEIKGIPINHGAAAAPDGTKLYFSSEADQTLDVVDSKTLAITSKRQLSKPTTAYGHAYHRIETGVRQIKFAELGRICAARASARLADVSVVAMRCDIRASSATVRYGIFNASAKGGRGKKAVPKTGFSMERQSNMGRT